MTQRDMTPFGVVGNALASANGFTRNRTGALLFTPLACRPCIDAA